MNPSPAAVSNNSRVSAEKTRPSAKFSQKDGSG